MQSVNIEHNAGIAIVRLNRPEKKNALNLEMFQQIDQAIKRLRADRQLRAVIVSANGEDFCTGLDVKSVMGNPLSAVRLLWKWLPGNANLAQRLCVGWRRLPVPVIAAISGRCWGGGMQIALGADWRVVHPDASLSIMEARWGLIPDMGGTLALREILRLPDAQRYAMTAEELCAQSALSIGLVDQISDSPMEAALAIARQYMECSPDAVAACKRLYKNAWGASERRVLASETWQQIRLLSGKNQRIKTRRQLGDKDLPFMSRQRW